MEMSILTDRQREAWALKEQGYNYGQIALEMGITYNGARNHIKNAERRFEQYEQYLKYIEWDKKTVDIQLTKGDLKIILKGMLLLEKQYQKEAAMNIRNDWRGRLPFEYSLFAKLHEKLRYLIH